MIQRAGVQPKPPRPVAPRFVDCPLQKPLPQPLADEVGHQAELDQLNFFQLATVEFGSADFNTLKMLQTGDQQGMMFSGFKWHILGNRGAEGGLGITAGLVRQCFAWNERAIGRATNATSPTITITIDITEAKIG